MTAVREKKLIGVSLLTLHSRFYEEMKAGIERACSASGYELLLEAGEFDAGKQCAQLDRFVERKVDAILFTPCDSSAVDLSVSQANRARIPVFTMDIASTGARGTVTSHIASDNALGGRKAADLVIEALGGKGNVMVTTHLGVTSVIDRVRGFREAIGGAPGMRIVGQIPIWTDPRAQSRAIMKGLLARMPDLNAVFCINDEIALGTLAALEEAGRVGKVVLVGYDATSEARAAIDRGAIYGDVVQFPSRIGELAVKAVRDHLSGVAVPGLITVEVGVVTRAARASPRR